MLRLCVSTGRCFLHFVWEHGEPVCGGDETRATTLI